MASAISWENAYVRTTLYGETGITSQALQWFQISNLGTSVLLALSQEQMSWASQSPEFPSFLKALPREGKRDPCQLSRIKGVSVVLYTSLHNCHEDTRSHINVPRLKCWFYWLASLPAEVWSWRLLLLVVNAWRRTNTEHVGFKQETMIMKNRGDREERLLYVWGSSRYARAGELGATGSIPSTHQRETWGVGWCSYLREQAFSF